MYPCDPSHFVLLFLRKFSFKKLYFPLGEAKVDKEFSANYPSSRGQPMAPILDLLTRSSVSRSISSTGSFLLAPSLGCAQQPGWMRSTNRNVLYYKCAKKTLSDCRPGLRIYSPAASVCFPVMTSESRSSQGGEQEERSWIWGRLACRTPWLLVPAHAKCFSLPLVLPVSLLSMCGNCSQKNLPILIREK